MGKWMAEEITSELFFNPGILPLDFAEGESGSSIPGLLCLTRAAMWQKMGMPWVKLVVPSMGSRYQV